MKFIANHTVIVGKGPAAKEVVAGETMPKVPADELQRLADLGAITAIDDSPVASGPADSSLAQKAATEKSAAEKAAAEKASAERTAADRAASEKAAADRLAAAGQQSLDAGSGT